MAAEEAGEFGTKEGGGGALKKIDEDSERLRIKGAEVGRPMCLG